MAQVNSFPQSYSRFEKRRSKGKSVKSYLSYDVSVGLAFSSADYAHSYSLADESGNIAGSNPIARSLDVRGLQVGTHTCFHLFDVMPDGSSVVFNINPIGYVFHYNMGRINTSENSSYDYTLSFMEMGVPLTLDYKTGGEAVFDKSCRTSFTPAR